MLKKIDIDDDPLLRINWRKLIKYLKALLSLILKIIAEIIKAILKILTFIVLLIYRFYIKLREFCKSKIRGFWIVLL